MKTARSLKRSACPSEREALERNRQRQQAGRRQARRPHSAWTFVIGKDGKIAYIDSKVNAAEDSKKIQEVVEKLSK